jgi:protein-L-isoaspartate(D-aspartate) O-methyltransferase
VKPMTDKHLAVLRRHMVELVELHFDLASDEIGKDRLDPRVADAMGRVPRHLFVPEPLAGLAYHDTPLPIGFGKTLSQPFIAALMIDLLGVEPEHKVLEVGTGLGYQAALLAELAAQVWTVEIVEEFAEAAELILRQLGLFGVEVRAGDGTRGWPEHAPFDRVLVTAAAKYPPQPLIDQLSPGGRLVMPVGTTEVQHLTIFDKRPDGTLAETEVIPVQFTKLEIQA